MPGRPSNARPNVRIRPISCRCKRQPSAGYRVRLLELISIIDRLSETMDAGYVPLWLNKPSPVLGDERPLVALGEGRYKEVSRLVAELENDSFS